MSNEGQFAFNVEDVIMAQWLRGTLTYIIKVGIFKPKDFCPFHVPRRNCTSYGYMVYLSYLFLLDDSL